MIVDIRYWDSDCFLGWLNDEPDKIDECRAVLDEAEAGRILIVTSALTLTEVIKLKGEAPLGRDKETKIIDFFKNQYISVRNVDRYVAEDARGLIWTYPALWPKDSIHVATAIRLHIPFLNTFDEDLIKLSGQLGDPPLRIERPKVSSQPKLSFGP